MTDFVLFLDFDGPLFPDKVLNFPENNPPHNTELLQKLEIHPFYSYWKADPICVTMLNWMHIKGVKAVISSSWAKLHEKPTIEGLFNVNSIHTQFHQDWRTSWEFATRGQQIAQWLKGHPEIVNYLILDDKKSAPDLFSASEEELAALGLSSKNIVLVDEVEGLRKNEVDKIRRIVNLVT